MKAGIAKIDPVVGMEQWEINIEGLHRKFKDNTRQNWPSSRSDS